MKKYSNPPDKEGHTALLRRLALILAIGYVAVAVLFYFLAGEQLHLRQSRNNTELPVADSGTVELVSGSVVEQRFTTEIQHLEQIMGSAQHDVDIHHPIFCPVRYFYFENACLCILDGISPEPMIYV